MLFKLQKYYFFMKSTAPEMVFLDAMRGIAALVVFLGHARFFLTDLTLSGALVTQNFLIIFGAAILQLFVFGHQAVILFVFLSGFWVCYSQINKQLTKKDFAKRRLSKVYLPYLFALIISAVIDLAAQFFMPQFYSQLVLNVYAFVSTFFLFGALYTGFGSNIPLITVAIIIICYFLYMIFEKHLVIGLLVGIAGLVAYYLTLEPILLVLVYWNVWVFGAITSTIFLKKGNLLSGKKRYLAYVLDLMSGLFVLWVLYSTYINPTWIANIPQDMLLGIAIAYLVYRLVTAKPRIRTLSFFNKLSDYSYSLYLIHYPFIVVVYALYGKSTWFFFGIIVVVFVATLGFQRLVSFSNGLYFKGANQIVTKGNFKSKK